MGMGFPRIAKSSTSHNLNKITLVFWKRKEGKKTKPEGETFVLVAFESY